jgi:hypothetical protein
VYGKGGSIGCFYLSVYCRISPSGPLVAKEGCYCQYLEGNIGKCAGDAEELDPLNFFLWPQHKSHKQVIFLTIIECMLCFLHVSCLWRLAILAVFCGFIGFSLQMQSYPIK